MNILIRLLIIFIISFLVFVSCFSCRKSSEIKISNAKDSNSEIISNESKEVTQIDTLINLISIIDCKYLNRISLNKEDLVVVVVGNGCIPCKMAKEAIVRNFYNQLDKFALIDYKEIQNNYIFKAKDIDVGIPFTIIIKNGVMVGQIRGFSDESYTKTLANYLK